MEMKWTDEQLKVYHDFHMKYGNMLLTREQVIKKYKNKYISLSGRYDYKQQKWMFEVKGVKNKIWENHNLPEVELSGYKD